MFRDHNVQLSMHVFAICMIYAAVGSSNRILSEKETHKLWLFMALFSRSKHLPFGSFARVFLRIRNLFINPAEAKGFQFAVTSLEQLGGWNRHHPRPRPPVKQTAWKQRGPRSTKSPVPRPRCSLNMAPIHPLPLWSSTAVDLSRFQATPGVGITSTHQRSKKDKQKGEKNHHWKRPNLHVVGITALTTIQGGQ